MGPLLVPWDRCTDETVSWFTFLCKNVNIQVTEGVPRVANHVAGIQQSHYDGSWIRAGFFLEWIPVPSTLEYQVTLICFGASDTLIDRFERLNKTTSTRWKDAVTDPYLLFGIVLSDLFLRVEGIIYDFSQVFLPMEMVSLSSVTPCDRLTKAENTRQREHHARLSRTPQLSEAYYLSTRKLKCHSIDPGKDDSSPRAISEIYSTCHS